jgi:hypothetical protein
VEAWHKGAAACETWFWGLEPLESYVDEVIRQQACLVQLLGPLEGNAE